MKKPLNKPPDQSQIKTPYGLPALVNAAKKMASEHVLSEVTELIGQLVQLPAGDSWKRFTGHKGWVDPGNKIGVLDFSVKYSEDLRGASIALYLWPVAGGDGEPIYIDYTDAMAYMAYRFDTRDWGMMTLTELTATGDNYEWAKQAAELFQAAWEDELLAGNLRQLSNHLTAESCLTSNVGKIWKRDNLKDISTNLALELEVLDDEDDAPDFCSSLEFEAQKIHLVTPWLAEKLKERGAVADTQLGLPLWSRDNSNEPHLEEAFQDIVYEKFGESVTTELVNGK